ncbi:MAG: hypothetical protein IKL88_06350 [Erysipelotrichales bacterium]|nr:hypothetical protein [Erysipelotrichales bacterium]
MMNTPPRTADFRIISSEDGNRYQFICALSHAILYTTRPIPESLDEGLMIAWEEGKQYFNCCYRCGRWVSDVMYNPDVCECVECAPWEDDPKFCSLCGQKILPTHTYCRECGTRLRYKEVWK